MLIPTTRVLSFAILAFAMGRVGVVQSQQYAIDPAHTAVAFQISHLDLSWTHGRFNEVSGGFSIDPSGDRSQFVLAINAASIDTGNQKRDDHLRSPDFLFWCCALVVGLW
ncbi:MAG: YceI family protein [Candidatus Paceibacterota bacterium]